MFVGVKNAPNFVNEVKGKRLVCVSAISILLAFSLVH